MTEAGDGIHDNMINSLLPSIARLEIKKNILKDYTFSPDYTIYKITLWWMQQSGDMIHTRLYQIFAFTQLWTKLLTDLSLLPDFRLCEK